MERCAKCDAGGRLIALACMHCVHRACLGAACPRCRNGALDLAAALVAEGLADPGDWPEVAELPVRSSRAPNDLLASFYKSGACAVQDEAKTGKWLFVRDGARLRVLFVNGAVCVRWSAKLDGAGRVRDYEVWHSGPTQPKDLAEANAFCMAKVEAVLDAMEWVSRP